MELNWRAQKEKENFFLFDYITLGVTLKQFIVTGILLGLIHLNSQSIDPISFEENLR